MSESRVEQVADDPEGEDIVLADETQHEMDEGKLKTSTRSETSTDTDPSQDCLKVDSQSTASTSVRVLPLTQLASYPIAQTPIYTHASFALQLSVSPSIKGPVNFGNRRSPCDPPQENNSFSTMSKLKHIDSMNHSPITEDKSVFKSVQVSDLGSPGGSSGLVKSPIATNLADFVSTPSLSNKSDSVPDKPVSREVLNLPFPSTSNLKTNFPEAKFDSLHIQSPSESKVTVTLKTPKSVHSTSPKARIETEMEITSSDNELPTTEESILERHQVRTNMSDSNINYQNGSNNKNISRVNPISGMSHAATSGDNIHIGKGSELLVERSAKDLPNQNETALVSACMEKSLDVQNKPSDEIENITTEDGIEHSDLNPILTKVHNKIMKVDGTNTNPVVKDKSKPAIYKPHKRQWSYPVDDAATLEEDSVEPLLSHAKLELTSETQLDLEVKPKNINLQDDVETDIQCIPVSADKLLTSSNIEEIPSTKDKLLTEGNIEKIPSSTDKLLTEGNIEEIPSTKDKQLLTSGNTQYIPSITDKLLTEGNIEISSPDSSTSDIEGVPEFDELVTESNLERDWNLEVPEFKSSSYEDIFDIRSSDDEAEAQIPTTVDASDDDSARRFAGTTSGSWWQYKQFPKGPKGNDFNIVIPPIDPHQPVHFVDPVFWPSDYRVSPQILSTGKPRLGDGNDVSPNVEVLKRLGEMIKKLTEEMDRLNDVSEKKTKMKLASRLSRVKRRANHEANKIIFQALEAERDALSKAVKKIRSRINNSPGSEDLVEYCAEVKDKLPQPVAGHRSEYVNRALDAVDNVKATDSESDFSV